LTARMARRKHELDVFSMPRKAQNAVEIAVSMSQQTYDNLGTIS
jgi:hypothetical protein